MPEPDPSREWKPYHHGNLRAALLTAAEQTLRERGIGQVSLRDLARQAGVSHAAPGRHFRDRQALLNALSEAGYTRLSDEIATATGEAGDGLEAQLRAMAATYVRFAVENGALLELMLADAKADVPAPAPGAAKRPYGVLGELIRHGQETGELRPGDPERLRLIILATFQGIAALVSSRQVPAEQADALVTDATALFIRA
ncbi:MAG: TetR/AcrR family transcriptional regulator [Trebonia sp.]